MGLAPCEPRYVDLIRERLIDVKDDGTFRLDMQYFNYCTGLTTNRRFDERAACASAGERTDPARDGHRGVDSGDRGHRPAPGPYAARGDRSAQSLPGRRGRAQLRRQRPRLA